MLAALISALILLPATKLTKTFESLKVYLLPSSSSSKYGKSKLNSSPLTLKSIFSLPAKKICASVLAGAFAALILPPPRTKPKKCEISLVTFSSAP